MASRKMGETYAADKLAELEEERITQPTADAMMQNYMTGGARETMDTIHVRIPKSLRDALEREARRRGFKFSYYVRYILNQAVDAAEKE